MNLKKNAIQVTKKQQKKQNKKQSGKDIPKIII